MRKSYYKKKLLLEDLKFPLSWDCEDSKMFIFDSEMSMVAQVNYRNFPDRETIKHPFEKLVGEYKELENTTDFYKLVGGDYINPLTMEVIGCVRGWGRLQQLKSPNGEKRQDNIAAYILNVLNS